MALHGMAWPLAPTTDRTELQPVRWALASAAALCPKLPA